MWRSLRTVDRFEGAVAFFEPFGNVVMEAMASGPLGPTQPSHQVIGRVGQNDCHILRVCLRGHDGNVSLSAISDPPPSGPFATLKFARESTDIPPR